MAEHKKHEDHECCGGHGKAMANCHCMNKPWLRLLVLFTAALVVFYIGVCVGSRADRFERRGLDNGFSCPMNRLR